MIRVENLSNFIEVVLKSSDKIQENESGMIITNRYYYRGHSDLSYELIPSIARVDETGKSNLNYEYHMINRAKQINPNELNNISNDVNLLAKLQHYGLQTRLLDITSNALVALFFACMSNFDKDGEVICFKVESDSIKLPESSITLAYSIFSFMLPGEYKLDKLLKLVKERYFYSYIDKDGNNILGLSFKMRIFSNEPLFISHAIQSEREIRQQASFLLFTNKFDKNTKTFLNDISPIEKNSRLISQIIVIPKEIKRELLIGLKSFGISHEFLFPEFANRCKSINSEIRNLYSDNTHLYIEQQRKHLNFEF